MVSYIYVQYVLFTRSPELIVLEVLSPQFIVIVPTVVDTENAVIVLPAAGVAKVQIVFVVAEGKTFCLIKGIPSPNPSLGILFESYDRPIRQCEASDGSSQGEVLW